MSVAFLGVTWPMWFAWIGEDGVVETYFLHSTLLYAAFR